jgi:hypothetical protein
MSGADLSALNGLPTLRRYREIIEELTVLSEQDHRARQDDINGLFCQLANDGLALRALALKLALHPGAPRLSGSQSFTLESNRAFILRINSWYPPSRLPEVGAREYDKYFSIDVCHNHNFDFFTCCVLGPGYESEFLETSDDLEHLQEGDVVSFDRSWTIRLGLGDSVFVPRETQFHTQRLPERFSATLNLIPLRGQSRSGRQYTLADDCRTVKRVIVGDAFIEQDDAHPRGSP